MRALFIVVLAACTGAPDAATASDGLAYDDGTHPVCIDPAAYGALPDDGLDDRPGIQAAIDADVGHSVCLRTGLYELSKVPLGQGWHSLHVYHSVDLHGQGMGTVLDLTGDGTENDWYAIQVAEDPANQDVPVTDVSIRNLKLSKDGAYNTEEQTHAIQVGVGPVGRIDLGGLWFNWPSAGPNNGGDCIRLLGEVTNPVFDINIHDNVFTTCDRSGVSFQRGVSRVLVNSNLFLQTGDSPIDFEPTSTGGIDRVAITSNLMVGNFVGDQIVALSGNISPATDIDFSHNVLFGGLGIWMFDVTRGTVVGNHVQGVFPNGRYPFEARTIHDVTIANNSFTRLSGSASGTVLKVSHHNTLMSENVDIQGNRLINEAVGGLLNLDANSLKVSNNTMRMTANAGAHAINIEAISANLGRIQINDNFSAGTGLGFVRFGTGYGYTFGTIMVSGNMSEANGYYGLQCQGVGGFTKPIIASGNYFNGATIGIGCVNINWTSGTYSIVGQYP